MNFHAHIYWQNEDQRSKALQLRQQLSELNCFLGSMHSEAIGPHPLPMYQVNYDTNNQKTVEELLSSSGLIILLHEDTDDDLKDHTTGARWLGQKLKLNLQWLEEYTRRKNELGRTN